MLRALPERKFGGTAWGEPRHRRFERGRPPPLRRRLLAAGAGQPGCAAGRCGRGAFDFQHGFGEIARGGVREFRRENLCEAPFHFVHFGDFGFAKAEKLSVAAADDGQEFLLLPVPGLAHEYHELAPVKRLGRRFGHVEVLAGRGEFRPGFQHHDASGGGVGDAHEARGCGEVVFGAVVGEALRDKHDQAVTADQKERRCDAAGSAHAVIRIVLAASEEIVERFGFWFWRRHVDSVDGRGGATQAGLPAHAAALVVSVAILLFTVAGVISQNSLASVSFTRDGRGLREWGRREKGKGRTSNIQHRTSKIANGKMANGTAEVRGTDRTNKTNGFQRRGPGFAEIANSQ